MMNIYEKLENKIELWRSEVSSLMKEHGDKVISQVTVKQAYGGLRGVRSLVTDTSKVPDDKGLTIRGRLLKDLSVYTPEEIYYLLLTGDLPNEAELNDFVINLKFRKHVPYYVWDVLKAMPKDSHPMTMLNTAILVMQKESVFARMYEKGIKKEEFWKPTLEDALNIVAKIPSIAAAIYRIRFNKGELIQPDPFMDITGDFVYMMGVDNASDEFKDLIRMFLITHSDHEGGNVSAFTTTTVSSALSDMYYAVSAGFDGLAGPLHGLANQESIMWVLDTLEQFGGYPTKDQLKQHVRDTLNAGRVVPGYGHAILRITDPRFELFLEFGKKYCGNDPVFNTVSNLYDVVPDILKEIQKIKDPWPNVDACSGSLLYHYGLKEFSYYTVIFAVSRALGLTAQTVMARALEYPITRPKSVTTDWIKEYVNAN
jgi:citrate synthase